MFKNKSNQQIGLFYAFISYAFWGLFPLFWKLLSHIPALTVLSHRIIWSCIFLLTLAVINKQYNFVACFKNKELLTRLGLAGFAIALNWGVYIYAVETNQIVAASLGYYINPLLNVVLGVLFFKEHLNIIQKTAVGFAFLGVTYFTYQHGYLPWVSILLGISFSLYGLLKKKAKVDSLTSLTLETVLLFPFAFAYLSYNGYNGGVGFCPETWSTGALFVIAGIITAIPLFWFGKAAQLLPLSTLGFIQYLTPTIQLIMAVVIWHEEFTYTHLICFILVWTGLILYTYNALSKRKKKTTCV